MRYGAPTPLTKLQQFIFGQGGAMERWRDRRMAAKLREFLPAVTPGESDVVLRLRAHVYTRGGPTLSNGAWAMMLEAADEIERLRG